eukprot:s1365_g11.t1
MHENAVLVVHFLLCGTVPPRRLFCFEVMDANLLLFKTVIAGDGWGTIAVPVIEAYPATAVIFVGSLLTLVFGATWSAKTWEVIRDLFEPEIFSDCRQSPPAGVVHFGDCGVACTCPIRQDLLARGCGSQIPVFTMRLTFRISAKMNAIYS